MAPTKPHAFTFHGIRVEDPYHWLKDEQYPEVNNPEILDYLQQENAYFEASMAPLKPLVEEIFAELKARQPAADESVPYKKNHYWYQWRFTEGAQYRSWFRAPLAEPANWQCILDENTLAENVDYFQLGGLAISPNGRYLAYSTDTDGSERYVLKIKDLQSERVLDQQLTNTMGSPIWSADSEHFVYTVLNDQWRPFEIRCHHITNSDATADSVLYTEVDESYRVGLDQTQSEQYIILTSGDHITSEHRVVPTALPLATPRLILERTLGHEYDVDHANGFFFIRSNWQQKNFTLYRVADFSITDKDTLGDKATWEPILTGNEHRYIVDHLALKQHLIVCERHDGLDQIRVMDYSLNDHLVDFPQASYSADLGNNAEFDTDTLRISYESMVTPATVYDYDFTQRALKLRKVQEIPSGFDGSKYQTQRINVPARDGSAIPVSIVFPHNFVKDGQAPLYLYGYGAYGMAIPPGFSTARLSLLDRGYAFAIAHIRGGDDLGYHWYEQGKLDQRTNTFNDFIDVAEQLITEGYSSAGKLCIAGGSAGGELMGAVVNQAPHLWGAVAAHVPFVDVLNTMLDTSLPLTPIEWPEWGNPIEDVRAFEHIQSYSPYDQLKEGDYPPMLVTAGLNDPRVTYWEPAKYVAKLRTLKRNNNLLLLKTNMGAGHGGKSGRFDALEEIAEEYAFFISTLT